MSKPPQFGGRDVVIADDPAGGRHALEQPVNPVRVDLAVPGVGDLPRNAYADALRQGRSSGHQRRSGFAAGSRLPEKMRVLVGTWSRKKESQVAVLAP